MESPYYEMTHDFKEENALIESGYRKGYHDAMMQYPEIVRCKNCVHYNDEGIYTVCFRHNGLSPECDWFCADGERINKD